MPQGEKLSATDKLKSQADHIETGCDIIGAGPNTAEERIRAIANKLLGRGKMSVPGRRPK
jgi:hypothetical protein